MVELIGIQELLLGLISLLLAALITISITYARRFTSTVTDIDNKLDSFALEYSNRLTRLETIARLKGKTKR